MCHCALLWVGISGVLPVIVPHVQSVLFWLLALTWLLVFLLSQLPHPKVQKHRASFDNCGAHQMFGPRSLSEHMMPPAFCVHDAGHDH